MAYGGGWLTDELQSMGRCCLAEVVWAGHCPRGPATNVVCLIRSFCYWGDLQNMLDFMSVATFCIAYLAALRNNQVQHNHKLLYNNVDIFTVSTYVINVTTLSYHGLPGLGKALPVHSTGHH